MSLIEVQEERKNESVIFIHSPSSTFNHYFQSNMKRDYYYRDEDDNNDKVKMTRQRGLVGLDVA